MPESLTIEHVAWVNKDKEDSPYETEDEDLLRRGMRDHIGWKMGNGMGDRIFVCEFSLGYGFD